MSPRHAPAHRTRTQAAAAARAAAIVVAVAGIGVGTWILGTEPDSGRSTDGSAVLTDTGLSAVPGVPTAPLTVVSEPPLSVAPAPPAEARRDAITRAARNDRAPSAKKSDKR